MSHRHNFLVSVLALACCAGLAHAQAPRGPQPGPEVRKLAVMVGKFSNEGEMKAGAMGPNSPAQKATGTDDCRWVARGFGVLCNSTVDMAGMKVTEVAILYYDPTSKMYHYHSVDSAGGVENSEGRVNGNLWTWTGQASEGGKVLHSRFIMKVDSKDSFEYTVDSGDSETSMKPVMSGKETRVTTVAQPALKPASQ
jgi:Protein of unknown function (DUF1579)